MIFMSLVKGVVFCNYCGCFHSVLLFSNYIIGKTGSAIKKRGENVSKIAQSFSNRVLVGKGRMGYYFYISRERRQCDVVH